MHPELDVEETPHAHDTPPPTPAERRPTAGAADPGRLGRAARRSWWIILLFALIIGGAGVATAMQREPVWSSEALLTVGRADLATQTLPGYAQATQNLAGTYSRLVSGEKVLGPVARRNRLSYVDLRNRIIATRVPETSVISISAESPSRQTAITLTKQVAASARAYVAVLTNSGQQDARKAYTRFLSATNRATRRRALLTRLRDREGSSTARIARIARLDAKAAAAELIASTNAGIYQAARQPNAQSFKGAELLVPAVAASSDQDSYVQRLGFIGLVVGALFGLALAVLREGRRSRA